MLFFTEKKSIMITRTKNLPEKIGTGDSQVKSAMCLEYSAESSGLSATHLIHRAEQCATDIFARTAPPGLLTPRQYAILVAIEENEGISQTGLVGKTGIDRSTLADIVRRMMDKGLVQRQRTTADARAYAVRLTRRGTAMLRRMRPHAEEVDRLILQALPEEQRSLFLSMLHHLVGQLATEVEAP
jgi:MarR family transcriptional regulator, temperature-dependent positive regulator of motility